MRRVPRGRAIGVGVGVIAVLALVIGVCTGDGGDDGDGQRPAAPVTDAPFTIRLSAGSPVGSTAEPVPVVAGEELAADVIQQILDRLPDFGGSDGDRIDFQRPPEPLPRPRVGETIDEPFGASDATDPPDVAEGPLQVLRHQPDGDVEIAPFLSVTFDQPMVEVGTLEQLDDADVPVRVTPELDGRWRWIGTRTLRFEHATGEIDRLPMATEYEVEVPAGTTSRTGGELEQAHRWTFRTPPPSVQTFLPESDRIDTRPVFLATFDQRVDPAAVLDSTLLRVLGAEQGLRLATDAEIEADDAVRQRVEQTLDGRWVAFTPEDELPRDTAISVSIGPGTPSAEGPRVSEEPSVHEARTYAALDVVDQQCGHGEGCRPGSELRIELNNPLDLEAFDSEEIELDPDVPASIGAFENMIVVQAATSAGSTQGVRLPASLRDAFGQTLGDDETVRFEVGDAGPALVGFPTPLVTTDPMADEPSVSVRSVGHEQLRVDLHRVTPEDWTAYQRALREWDHEGLPTFPDWPEVSSETVEVPGDVNDITETTIDLSEAVDGDTGHVVVTVSTTRELDRDSEDYWNSRPTVTWAQVTDIGVDAVLDQTDLVAWTTSLETGEPLEGVSLRLSGTGEGAETDASGLASLPFDSAEFLVASRGDDRAILPAQYAGVWEQEPVSDVVRWYVFDDRGVYRPGETVHAKGWVRRLTLTGDADIVPLGGEPTVRYRVFDAFGNELANREAQLTATGGFDIAVELPAGAATGPAMVDLSVSGVEGLGESSFSHRFQIQEFRRPEFEVDTRAESPAPHVLTGPVTLAATASYFAGGVLRDAPVTWRVTHQTTAYTPPHHPSFSFGVWRPWWIEDTGAGFGGADVFGPPGEPSIGGRLVEEGIDPCCGPAVETEEFTYAGRTDGTGTHYLQLDFEGDPPDEPVNVSANAAVTDVNRQSFASTEDLLVHPASLYVGLRSDRTFVRQGDPLTVEAIVTDIDGEIAPDHQVTMTAARLEQRFEGGEWSEVDVDEQECTVTSGDEAVSCEFDTEVGGRYRITATVEDDDGGQNRSEMMRWVSGADAVPTRTVEQEQVVLVPAAEEHVPGDTAEILVASPFGPAQGRLTLGHNGIDSTRIFEVAEGSTVLEIPIGDELVPGVDVRVDLVGTAPRTRDDGTVDDALPPRPAFATGSLRLPVEPTSARLTVDAAPADAVLEPGDSTAVTVEVADPAGAPVAGAEVALVVVDEAVHSLIDYELGDPIEAMYQPLADRLIAEHGRRSLLLTAPELLGGEGTSASTTVLERFGDLAGTGGDDASEESADGELATAPTAGGSAGGGIRDTPIEIRREFDALAAFVPAELTGEDGRVTVEVDLPDSLTRYRVMAVAADGGARFGSGESTITARLPLMVRPSAPRFANFGDRFELPVVLQNQTDEDLEVDVVAEVANLALTGPAGQRVTVPADDRVEVRFPVITEDAGTARYRVTAVSGDRADSSVGDLPVYTPVTTEAFATYGTLDDGAVAQPLLTPEGVVEQFGGLEIDTSSTALQALTDAVVYLAEYPYRSSDAYASRIIALVSLRDVFAAFASERVPSPEELDATIRSDIDELVALQSEDGGFGTWRPGGPSDPYRSVQAAHALVAAEAAGYAVPGDARGRALEYARRVEDHFPREWPEQLRDTVSAYALHVRDLAGDRDPGKAAQLYRSADDLGLDGLAWLWPVVDDAELDAAIERTFGDRVTETPGAANFTTGYDEDAHLVLASDRRTDGVVLDALIRQRPDSDLIAKVVNGLIGNQVKGRWSNVQENGFVLLALKRYFDTFEAQTPSFVARAWLGDAQVAEHAYEGRTIDRRHTLVPMTELAGDPDLVIAKDGPGRLYYRLGLRYAPDDLVVEPRDEGFVVDRTYEAVEDPDDVRRGDDGTWHVTPGAMVRVRLTMVADSARTNMALVDPLPAGLEAVNPDLAASPRPPTEEEPEGEDGGPPRPFTWYGWTWHDHEALRDDRVAAYASYLPAGTYEYTYVARATTPGRFVVPPTKAEEIYAPEVFGRSASTELVVG